MSVISFRKVRDFAKIPGSHRKNRFSRAEMTAFDAHGWFCHYCGSKHALTTDHIIPRTHGGSDLAENLVPACATCNRSRGYRPYAEFVEIVESELAAYVAMFCFGDAT